MPHSGSIRRRLAFGLAGLLLGGALLPGCATGPPPGAPPGPDLRAIPKWGPFRGQFVDAETGQPIVGGVVVAVWLEYGFTIAGGSSRFYDVRAAVSGPDGRFEVPGIPAILFGFKISEPILSWFAPGYRKAGQQYWFEGVLVTPATGRPFADSTLLRMRTRRSGDPLPWWVPIYSGLAPGSDLPPEIRRRTEDAVNLERNKLGLPPVYLTDGEVQRR